LDKAKPRQLGTPRVKFPDRSQGVFTMSPLLAELEQQACTLLPEERAQLAEVLLESLHESSLSEIELEWEREIEKRVAAFDRGEQQTYPAEDVFAEARRMTP